MSPLPTTQEGLEALGYRFEYTKTCGGTGCGMPIAFWRTPNDKLMPLNAKTLLPHWGECPATATFKKKKKG